MKTERMSYGIIMIGVFLLVTGCTGSTDGLTGGLTGSTTETITIGAVYTLSGDYVDFLHGSTAGTRMAIDDFREATGLNVRFIEEDDKSCSDKTGGINKLVNLDGVDAIVGTTCSSMTLAMAPIAESSETVMISPVSTSPDVTNAGKHVFRTIASDDTKLTWVAEQINSNYARVGLLYDGSNDVFTSGIRDIKEQLDAEVVAEQKTGAEQVDFRTELLKIHAAEPEVLVLGMTLANQFAEVMTQWDELGFEPIPVYVWIETVEDPKVIELGGKDVEDIIFPAFASPSGPAYERFATAYKAKYNESVPAYAAEAYDAAMIALKAVAASDGSKEDILEKTEEIGTDYQGVSGTITFDENGDVEKPIVAKTIRDGEFVFA